MKNIICLAEVPMVRLFTIFKGSAYSVKNKQDDSFYVAKKMMLEGMGERDKTLAWGEVHNFIK
jgi:hypothetical protein